MSEALFLETALDDQAKARLRVELAAPQLLAALKAAVPALEFRAAFWVAGERKAEAEAHLRAAQAAIREAEGCDA